MKVDLVVNSMIQQIDRNLQSQIIPMAAFRAGEILHGRVMLDAGDRPQIRLDSGELLSALPSGDVQLFAGATVTLRVTGNMDGQFVMQLLEQEMSGAAARQAPEAAVEPLARLGMGNSPQGRAVLAAMETMRVPLREETARQAMTILGAFPGLEPQKAVFLAANGITPTDAAVSALNALIDEGATTGGELMKFVDMLSAQALKAESPAAAAQPSTPGTPAAATAPVIAEQAARTPGRAGNAPVEAAPEGWVVQADGDEIQTGPQVQGMTRGQATPQTGNIAQQVGQTSSMPARSALSQGEALMQLQSLMFVALGPEAAGQYAPVTAVLQQRGMAGEAVRLALDGSLAGNGEYEAGLAALASALPEGTAVEARALITKLAAGLSSQAEAAAAAAPPPQEASQSLQRVVREIMDVFVKLDADSATNTAELQKSSSMTHETAQRLPAELADAGAASPAAAQQLNRVESHIRLLDNISQYAYQQIPVEMNGRNKTVELYVMNRGGGGKKINPEKANILIALETENMGHLETLISVSSKNLRLRFGVENPQLAGHLSAYTGEISRAMQEIGYKLSDVRTQVTRESVTPLSAIAEAESWQESPVRLDIKL